MASSSSQHVDEEASQPNADEARTGPPTEDASVSSEDARKTREALLFWKRPAAWWLMVLAALSATLLTLPVGAQIELYTQLVCRVHRSEFQLASNWSPKQIPLFPPSFNMIKSAFTVRTIASTIQTPDLPPCSADPGVHAAVAKLTTALTFTGGVLTSLTVGWWGSFSDRHGRRRILGFTAIAQLICCLNFILVANYVQVLPGKYWFLLLDSIVLGAVGGTTSEIAAMMAYLSDILPPEQRSRLFGMVLGCFLVGIGIGPMLGSFVIRTTQNIFSVFFLAAGLRVVHACLVLFVLPESLTKAQMQRASIRHHEILPLSDEPTALRWLKRAFFFLEPLSIFWPSKVANQDSPEVGRRDWNLTILVLGYAMMFLGAASLLDQVLYAQITFGWDAEYVGYCFSSIGVSRAAFLCLILPFGIKLVRDRGAPKNKPASRLSEREPLLSDQNSGPKNTPPKAYILDLTIARLSILVDAVTYAVLPLAPTGIVFLVFISLGSFGAGLAPAVNSVALELYSRRLGKNATVESGRLFGAMSVAQALFANVLGPPIYGFIYAATVATHPKTIFFVALGNTALSFVLLSCVRVTPVVGDVEGDAEGGEDN
ncbi:major facilitator superfamily domain-containing protein [Mycena filopes]|nr:major facilitator superfamily domain-containing protein [Mycena filopes]